MDVQHVVGSDVCCGLSSGSRRGSSGSDWRKHLDTPTTRVIFDPCLRGGERGGDLPLLPYSKNITLTVTVTRKKREAQRTTNGKKGRGKTSMEKKTNKGCTFETGEIIFRGIFRAKTWATLYSKCTNFIVKKQCCGAGAARS
jgi:hypothetical protein